jgi:hypothetical protein
VEEITTQSAEIGQQQAQWQGDGTAKKAEIRQLQAQWDGER